MSTVTRIPLSNGNGSHSLPAAASSASRVGTLDLLSRITPDEVRQSIEQNEAEFREAKDRYTRQKKLLRTLANGPGVRAAKKSEAPAGDVNDKIKKFLAEAGTATRDEIADKFSLPKNGASLKLKAMVKRGELKEKSGNYNLAKK